MQTYLFPIVLEKDEDGFYFVSCPVLQGCYTQGESYEEAMENIVDAIKLHLEDRQHAGEEIPHASTVSLSTGEENHYPLSCRQDPRSQVSEEHSS